LRSVGTAVGVGVNVAKDYRVVGKTLHDLTVVIDVVDVDVVVDVVDVILAVAVAIAVAIAVDHIKSIFITFRPRSTHKRIEHGEVIATLPADGKGEK
jgi:hypothetical protein